MKIKCPHCGATNQDVTEKDPCWQCGTILSAPVSALNTGDGPPTSAANAVQAESTAAPAPVPAAAPPKTPQLAQRPAPPAPVSPAPARPAIPVAMIAIVVLLILAVILGVIFLRPH